MQTYLNTRYFRSSNAPYLNSTTKECLEQFKGCNQLDCASTRGITRMMKRELRATKRTQHLINMQERAAKNQGGKR